MNKLFIKKENGKFFISGGNGWLSGDHIKEVNPAKYQFATDDFKPCMYYAVKWEFDRWRATVNEGRTTSFELPATATDEDIKAQAMEHAKLNGMDVVRIDVLTRPELKEKMG